MPEGRRDWGWLTLTLVASDLGAVLLAFWLAAALVWRTGVGINGGNDSDWLVLAMVPVLGLIFFAQGLYEPANLLVGAREFAGVFRASAYGLLAITVIAFVLHWPLSRSWTVASWALMTGLVIALRFGIRRVAAALRRRGRLTERAVIVGADEDSIALAEQVNQPGSGMRVVGILDDYIPTGTQLPGGLRVVGPSASLMVTWQRRHAGPSLLDRRRVLGARGATFDLLSFHSSAPFASNLLAKLPGLLNVLRGQLSLVGPRPLTEAETRTLPSMPLTTIQPGLTGPWRQGADPTEQATLDVYYVRSYSVWLDVAVLFERAMVRLRPFVKRCLDLAGATLLLVLTSPVVCACFAAVWIESGRPLIHRRRVIRRGGGTFDAFKIRTMVRDADRILSEDASLRSAFSASNKLASDPRITRVGRWLRRLSLDEHPQLVNVLRGEMSLVGPRMITQAELPEWGASGRLLLSVRPGLTGLWQVSGRQLLSKAERIRLDAEYVRRMSLRLDLMILARTLLAVASGHGAY